MDIEAVKQKLRDEGFEVFDTCPVAEPGMEYPEHTHETDVTHVITKGEMHFSINGGMTIYKPGERVDIPAHIPHSMKVGPDGCEWIVGEKK